MQKLTGVKYMQTNNINNIIKFSAPAPPAGTTVDSVPAPPAGTTGKVQSHNIIASSVKELQQAILDFANEASNTQTTTLEGYKQGDQYKGDNFTKLIAEYIKDPQAPISADESTKPVSKPEPQNIRFLIDSIKKIGAVGNNEKTPDGIWQGKTNAALHKIYDYTNAILNFSKDMNLYTNVDNDLKAAEAYKNLIPKQYTDLKKPGELQQRAKELIPHVKVITEIVKKFNNNILRNEKWKPYILQSASFGSYNKSNISKPDAISINEFVPNIDLKITFFDLLNKNNFDNFLNKNNIHTDQNTILETISKQLFEAIPMEIK